MARINVLSEITGTVWKLLVGVGEAVRHGQQLLIMESMKMEIPLTAPAAGYIHAIEVNEGESVAEGALAVVIEVP